MAERRRGSRKSSLNRHKGWRRSNSCGYQSRKSLVNGRRRPRRRGPGPTRWWLCLPRLKSRRGCAIHWIGSDDAEKSQVGSFSGDPLVSLVKMGLCHNRCALSPIASGGGVSTGCEALYLIAALRSVPPGELVASGVDAHQAFSVLAKVSLLHGHANRVRCNGRNAIPRLALRAPDRVEAASVD